MKVEIRVAILSSIVLLILGSVLLRTCDVDRSAGESLYLENCSNCHMDDGSGVEGLIPPLTDGDFLLKHESDLACWIFTGIEGKLTVGGREYEGHMPGNTTLTEAEIVNIIGYIKSQWAPQLKTPTSREVQESIRQCVAPSLEN